MSTIQLVDNVINEYSKSNGILKSNFTNSDHQNLFKILINKGLNNEDNDLISYVCIKYKNYIPFYLDNLMYNSNFKSSKIIIDCSEKISLEHFLDIFDIFMNENSLPKIKFMLDNFEYDISLMLDLISKSSHLKKNSSFDLLRHYYKKINLTEKDKNIIKKKFLEFY